MKRSAHTQQRVDTQEEKDRYVATKCLHNLLNKCKSVNTKPMRIKDPYDLKTTVINGKDATVIMNIEVKERVKNPTDLKKYPYAELKCKKLNDMREATQDGERLLYMVLLNESKMMLFDLDKIDFDKIEIFNWQTKKTQVEDGSPLIETPIYEIPYSMACCTFDCSPYYKDYYANNK